METKDFKFAIKSINETGLLKGHASVFGNIDLGNDVVDRGAFTRTLSIHGDRPFPLHWYHNKEEPIGGVECKEDDLGLYADGYLEMGIQRAKELYPLIKKGIIRGLSIGYRTIEEKFETIKEKTVRHIGELALYEVSLVTFPMNEEAGVETIKASDLELKPYPNEHACRLNDPDKYDKMRRGTRDHKGKEYSIIFGKLKGEDTWEEQAYRYTKDTWTADEARTHCKDHDGSFEAATGKYIECGDAEIFEAVKKAFQLPGFIKMFAKEFHVEPASSTLRDQIHYDRPFREHLSRILKDIKSIQGGK